MTSIGKCAFSQCVELTSVTMGDGLLTIENSAFYQCYSLISVIIPNSVKTIDSNAFAHCTNLASVTIGNGDKIIRYNAFEDCKGILSVTIHCKKIESWFSGMTSIEEVVFGDEVKSIGAYAFRGCTGLTSITIPNNLISIGEDAFDGCTGLKSLIIGSNVKYLHSNSFPKLIKVIWLPDSPPQPGSVNSLVNYVPNDSYDLSNKKVYPFLSSMFEVDGIKYVPVSPSERTCDAIDCSYNESAKNTNINNKVSFKGIDLAVKNINSYICSGNTFIVSLKMTYEGDIPDNSFHGCSSLQSVTFANNITSIGKEAFSGCRSLTSINIPNSVKSIGSGAFNNCSSLTSISIPNYITAISDYTFAGCSGMTSVAISNNVTTIGNSAFKDCSDLPSLTIPSSVKTISNYAFSGCSSLTSVTFHCNEIGPWFMGSTSINDVIIGNEVTIIGENAFKGLTNLKHVTTGNGITKIGDRAFSGCGSLDNFSFGSKVESIGKEAFLNCVSMTKLTSHAITPPTCGSLALDGINKFNCTLQVPEASIPVYQAADQWKDFFFIEPTGINEIKEDTTRQYRYYDLNGNLLLQPHKGVNILKSSNGKTKKVLVK